MTPIFDMTKHSKLSVTALVLVLTSILGGCSNSSDSDPAVLELASLEVSSGENTMYPEFSEDIQHYAIACAPDTELALVATARNSAAQVAIDGGVAQASAAEITIAEPADDQDIVVTVSDQGESGQYTLHCVDESFPTMQVTILTEDASTDLMLITPRLPRLGVLSQGGYIAIIDNNGVPRFHRRIAERTADFKRHPNGQYSYSTSIGRNEFDLNSSEIVLLDEEFNETERLETVGLNQTDGHDFLFTEEGNRLLLSYNSQVRDMSDYGLSTETVVGDSVIQELTPSGEVVFEWNSWDHIDMIDCVNTGFRGFPGDYAHINSIDLTPEGDLIGSFRGCGQVLKIDRPTGEVIWQLGGVNSDFEIVGDPFNEFCGQHTAQEIASDRVLMFDNGGLCLGDREEEFGQFSRGVEYQLDPETGQASYVAGHSLGGENTAYARSTGSVQLLESGNWFINWGNGPDVSITEVTPDGEEVYRLRMVNNEGTAEEEIAGSYRAVRAPGLSLD